MSREELIFLTEINPMAGSRTSYEATSERQSRQTEIWGDRGQRILHDTKVVVVGEGLLSEQILGGMAGLGIGDILCMDPSKSHSNKKSFLNPERKGKFSIREKVETLERINPYINIKSVTTPFLESMLSYENFYPNVIVDATNNPESKRRVLDYVFKHPEVSFISGCSNFQKAAIVRYLPKRGNSDEVLRLEDICRPNHIQGIIPSGIAAGIMLEELRKSRLKLDDNDKPLDKRVVYNIDSYLRTGTNSNIRRRLGDPSGIKCLVAGAGAIGNQVALALSLTGIGQVEIMDMDVIESHNLSRQLQLYDGTGQLKAKVLSDRVAEAGQIKSKAIPAKITVDSRRFFEKNRYDVIFGCFDNMRARYILSEIAKEFRMPYIDGGTSVNSGKISSYIPFKTECVSCKKKLSLTEERRGGGCAERPTPSVVMPNMVIGNAMVGEAINILRGAYNDKSFRYSSQHPDRIYIASEKLTKKDSCGCYKQIR